MGRAYISRAHLGRLQIGRAALAVLAIAAAANLLYHFPPERYGFYPVCPIHAFTGFLCPGCGATRALAALMHGQWAQAFQLNALVVTLAVPIACYLGMAVWRANWPRLPGSVSYALLAAGVVFTILRNLPSI